MNLRQEPICSLYGGFLLQAVSVANSVAMVLTLQTLWVSVAAAGAADKATTQIAAGAAAYAKYCASCHGEKLTGTMHAIGLTGAVFRTSWTDKSARKLYGRIISTMPLTDPGALDPKAVLDITVFILSVNLQVIPAAGYEKATDLNAARIGWIE
jgi:S-disulfanyl-L-cysteine oxidoreductase SoxD